MHRLAVTFLGSDSETEYEHAEVIFDRVIGVLARLVPGPKPEIFGERLATMCAELGDAARGWHVEVLAPSFRASFVDTDQARHRHGCSTRDQSNTRPGQDTSPQAG